MKKLTVLFVSVLAIVFVYLFIGCKCQADCEEDHKFPGGEGTFLYRPGDKIHYISEQNDTLDFTCSNRNIFTNHYSDDFPECCGTYAVETLHLSLETVEKDSFGIKQEIYPFPTITCTVIINNQNVSSGWNFFDPNNGHFDSLQIAGKTFYNITPTFDSVFFLGQNEIVGFILDGKEWRLLD